jgi:large subunit ribosomal protein L24
MRIAKNDIIEVIAGNDRGKRGKVLKVFPDTNRLLVEGVNFVHRHTRPTKQGGQGGIIEKEAPLNASNVLLVCSKCNSGVRVRTQVLTDNSKSRVCTKCGEMIERR